MENIHKNYPYIDEHHLKLSEISQLVQFLCAALVNNYIDKKITSD